MIPLASTQLKPGTMQEADPMLLLTVPTHKLHHMKMFRMAPGSREPRTRVS